MAKKPAAGSAAAKKKAAAKDRKKADAKAGKAAGAKAASAAEPPKRPRLVQDAARAPAAEQVKTLVRRLENLQKAAQEKSGEVGEAVAKAVETQHFDRTALGIARRLNRMSTQKLGTTLSHLFLYIDALGLEKRVADEPGLPMTGAGSGEGNGNGGGSSDMDDDDENVPSPSMQTMPSGDDAEEHQTTHH